MFRKFSSPRLNSLTHLLENTHTRLAKLYAQHFVSSPAAEKRMLLIMVGASRFVKNCVCDTHTHTPCPIACCDLYVEGSVLGGTYKTYFSTAQFSG
jgi:hypothetical protein